MPHDGWHLHDEEHHHHHHHDGHGHGPPTRRTVLTAAALLPFGVASAQTVDAAQRIAEAATRLLTSLDDGQRQKVLIAFESDNRLDWHYIPRNRPGLSLGEMRANQAEAARTLFASVLNPRGLELLDGVRLLEGVLREQQGSFRDPGRYYVSLFGTPGRFPWGWRFEGHHLSLNFTVVGDKGVAGGPTFMGTNPAEVRSGPREGLRVLGEEEDLARKLVKSLDSNQRRNALYEMVAPKEILSLVVRKATPIKPAGVMMPDLNAEQKELLNSIIVLYAERLRPELAADDLGKILKAGPDKIGFAWAGGLDRGEPHYYRIQGPTFLIEYDNTQNNANHVHSVWRDFEDDFGDDLLKRHYETAGAEHGHSK